VLPHSFPQVPGEEVLDAAGLIHQRRVKLSTQRTDSVVRWPLFRRAQIRCVRSTWLGLVAEGGPLTLRNQITSLANSRAGATFRGNARSNYTGSRPAQSPFPAKIYQRSDRMGDEVPS
jgi:hypothetical protein